MDAGSLRIVPSSEERRLLSIIYTPAGRKEKALFLFLRWEEVGRVLRPALRGELAELPGGAVWAHCRSLEKRARYRNSSALFLRRENDAASAHRILQIVRGNSPLKPQTA
jgi:hypothetical protein